MTSDDVSSTFNVFYFSLERRIKAFQLQMNNKRNTSMGKPTSTTMLLEIDLKLFTSGFIHCVPLCEIPPQIKE